ncbi:MAG: DEAD/DEAH box helicase, partial [Pseudomonadota bacterium]
MDLTRTELADYATFDDAGFVLQSIPAADLASIALGRYELPRRSGDAHLYRPGHALAEWVTQQAKSRTLNTQTETTTRLVFDYAAYGKKISTLEAYRGKTGCLTLKLISVDTLGNTEQHLVVAAATHDGIALAENDPEKLLCLPAQVHSVALSNTNNATLIENFAARKTALLREINQRSLGYFEQEVQKLDAWADDLKLGLEQEIKEIDRQIKEVRRTAAIAPMLEEKLNWQKQQRELEGQRNKLRKELFKRQDEIEAERNELITQLEAQLQQQVNEQTLFTVEWELR